MANIILLERHQKNKNMKHFYAGFFPGHVESHSSYFLSFLWIFTTLYLAAAGLAASNSPPPPTSTPSRPPLPHAEIHFYEYREFLSVHCFQRFNLNPKILRLEQLLKEIQQLKWLRWKLQNKTVSHLGLENRSSKVLRRRWTANRQFDEARIGGTQL